MPFQLVPFLIQLLIGTALQIVGFLLSGAGKKAQPEEMKDMESPTAEAGRPIPVIFGEVELSGVNIIWFGDKQGVQRKV